MKTLIYHKPISRFSAPRPPSNPCFPQILNSHYFLRIHTGIGSKTLTLCSAASLQPLRYGGWDDFQLASDSAEVNQVRNLLSSSGIGDKKYVFVYLFGFVCALAISRVRVSWVMVFPAAAIVFAVGFSMGLVNGGHLKGLKLNGSRKKITDESLRGCVEELKRYYGRGLELKNCIRGSIECNQITVNDLEGYIEAIDSVNVSLRNTIDVVESCVQSLLGGKQEKEGGVDNEFSKKGSKSGENWLNFSRFLNDLFGAKLDDAKSGKVGSIGNEKIENILASPAKERKPNSAFAGGLKNMSANLFDNPLGSSSSCRARDRVGNYVEGTRTEYMAFENEEKNFVGSSNSAEAVFDQTIYTYQNKTSRLVSNQQTHLKEYQDEIETMSSRSSSYDSVDVNINMNHVKASASSGSQQKSKTRNRNYWHLGDTEDDLIDSHRYAFENEAFKPKKRPNFADQEFSDEDTFGSSPSSLLDDDLEFNRYVVEANDLLREAKGCLMQKADDGRAEHILHKSAMLLSKAIEMRPMSLLAVGQLGNTYLLHGEIKLRTSRYLRSLLVRHDPMSVEEWAKARDELDDQLTSKDSIRSALVVACEECDELLIKAGRKYRMALSIDGNDMKALYNWGLALSFRAQLIADIGPSAARDADKVFMAAIDKFDAMMSKSNVYASDALFRWGAALQHRAQLRPSCSREKVKLLQQARQLYKDALQMDSGNPRLQEALSSCMSEADYWYT